MNLLLNLRVRNAAAPALVAPAALIVHLVDLARVAKATYPNGG